MMELDKRQRAMLKEMGVRVWQPMPETAAPLASAAPITPASPTNKLESAIDSGAAYARIYSPAAPFYTQKQPFLAVSSAAQANNTDSSSAWRVGTAQTLYADTAVQPAARWLVLLEAPASALEDFKPLVGDAGKLLDNMLRAA